MSLANYHTHTTRCHHASGTEEAYVQAAIEAGYTTLGFADHGPFPYESGYVSPMRMTMEELPGYVQVLQALSEKYRGTLTMHTGLEVEYYPRYLDHLKALRDRGIQYLILGQHFVDSDEDSISTPEDCMTDEGVLRYADHVTAALRTGLFTYLCHPDLFMRRRKDAEFTKACEQATDAICQCACECKIPLEYNLLGLRYELEGHPPIYPRIPFWRQAAKYPIQVIIGVDAHAPEQLSDLHVRNVAMQRLADLGLTPMSSLTL